MTFLYVVHGLLNMSKNKNKELERFIMKKIKKTTLKHVRKLAKIARSYEKKLGDECMAFKRPRYISERNRILNKINELLHCEIRYDDDYEFLSRRDNWEEMYKGNYKSYLCHITQMEF